jgi:C1A family cysteine protease
MSETDGIQGLGWLPDFPDYRDFTIESKEVSGRLKALGEKRSVNKMLTEINLLKPPTDAIKATADLSASFSPVENQGALGSCTANAGVALLEYFERRSSGRYIDASRLFLYKVTRKLLGWTGDSGAQIRTTMGAMVLFGVPPEKYWEYTDRKDPGSAGERSFDEEPPAFLYAYAQQYRMLSYVRLDPPGTTPDKILSQIKTMISGGYPSMFGFTVYSSIAQASTNGGKIPLPTSGENVLGGHAIVVCGYDDNMKIENTNVGGVECKGALMIRNSWGKDWGQGGYGWLPYDYVKKSLAQDWWTLMKAEWIDSGQFGF